MKLFGILLTLTIIINIKCDFSINQLRDYLQKKELYEILAEIKLYLGDDVAINM